MALPRNADPLPLATEVPSLTQREIDQRVFDLYDEYCHQEASRVKGGDTRECR